MASIEIDGKTFDVENGKMIIEVADDAGIHIPRFCYHKKLSVAANCRMCLVEVEGGRKTVPACATPITDGMKVFTKSKSAVKSQQAVMDFLLINHPLDCPICDQGGECELQDVSMGYGEDKSSYQESKRAVVNDNLGLLIETEMTRCIQCTRCVRFGEEVAGVRELGATGRGEHMQIGTYVKHSMTSEISANIIDLCPVGALTSKPYRYTARAWELSQHEAVAPHDCLGSNLYLHTRRNELMRAVPREKESINETWISDRDRFSYLGLKSMARAKNPMIKRNGVWETVGWDVALKFAAEGIARVIKTNGPEQFAAFASPSSTLEELYLLQKMMRNLGVQTLDHRLQQTDFRDDKFATTMPLSTLPYAALEEQETILLLGCNLLREVPLAGVRVQKASKNGASIYAINAVDYDCHVTMAGTKIVSPDEFPIEYARLLTALVADIKQLPDELYRLLVGLQPDAGTIQMADALRRPKSVLVTGALCENHPHAALLRTLVAWIAKESGAHVLRLTVGANAAGAWLAGMVPHRTVAGHDVESPGLSIQEALESKVKGYLLLGVEPCFDFANPAQAHESMLAAEFVVSLTGFQHESIQAVADVILPIALYGETSGTTINVDQTWQTVSGAMAPCGEARPAWKILRVLANFLHADGFEYDASEEILQEIKRAVCSASEGARGTFYPQALPDAHHALVRVGEWPLYRVDALVRHAQELQLCASADSVCVRMNPETAKRLQLNDTATVSQGNIEITLPLKCDERVALDVVWVANAYPETVDLGHSFAQITIKH